MSPRPVESPPSSLPLRAAPESSRPSAALLQTASSGYAACPPGTGRRVCGWPPDSLRSQCHDHPDPPCLAVLALHHAQDCFHGRHVGPVAVECLVAERETLAVDDERDHHLFAVGTVIARVAVAHHRILFRRTLHIRARQIVEQHVELGAEQLAVALLQMLLQLRLVRQNPVQASVQPRVVDLAFFDTQQIIQRGGWIPALFDRQFAARCAQPVNRQHGSHPRPRHVGLVLIHRIFKESLQPQALPKFQTEPARAELPRPLQSHLVQQHTRHWGIIRWRLHVRRKKFQLLRLTLLVEKLPSFSASAPARNRSARPDNTASSAADHRRYAPSRPTTSTCDPCRPFRGGERAETFSPDLVMRRDSLQEGWSALHRLFRTPPLQANQLSAREAVKSLNLTGP